MSQIYITKNKAPTRNSRKCLKYMARLEIRTPDQQVRSLALYPAELQAQ